MNTTSIMSHYAGTVQLPRLQNQAGAEEDIEKVKSQLVAKALLLFLCWELMAFVHPAATVRQEALVASMTVEDPCTSRLNCHEILDFLLEYRTMRSMFGSINSGEDFADVQRELKRESEELRSILKSRKARRATKGKSAKKGRGGKQPEWMTL
ncbi:unnamed protein product [Symbiodinium natans]|uniref:Uncharacterized protein n=1 Tax=Symbiodinium natans TaxID=878477 RepID=A0A812MKL1_9DINO|nr:unnamed protein product [Symbiodinium natans]